jgi:hypothetical protein
VIERDPVRTTSDRSIAKWYDAQILTLDQRGFGVFRLPGQGKKRPAVVVL